MKVQTHIVAVAAGALLVALVSTSVMGAERSTLMSHHTGDAEAVVKLEESLTPFAAMQGISATPMSDDELGAVTARMLPPSWVPLTWRLPMSQVDGNNIYVYVSDFGRSMWIDCHFVVNGC